MDNQGTSTFNSNDTPQNLGANFWNPTPQSPFSSQNQAQGFQNPQNLQNSQNQFQAYPQPHQATSPYYSSNFDSSNPQSTSSAQGYSSTTSNLQNSLQSQNLINKDFSQMTDEEKKEAERIAKANNRIDLLKTIGLIVISLLAVLFIGLFIWMSIKWNDANTNVQGKIDVAVAQAKNELQTKLENDFEEKEKYPFLTFTGPTDFGALSFEYPKTWSLYIPNNASRGGDFSAYLNPGQVNVVAEETVMSLRVHIKNELTDQVLHDYADKVESGEMTVSTTVVNGINVNVYTGKLDSDLMGIVCIFKIRDKTAIIQTDSSNVFKDDFYRILKTIRFNN